MRMSGVGGNAKSRMERILRLHEEIDAIKADIREIYAEEKSDGGDKTAMGAAISTIRKRAKDKDAFDEREALTDVYLNAYFGASHTHAREDTPAHEPQPSLMAGMAAASTPPEVAAEIAEPADAAVTAGNDLREPVAAEQGQIIREGDAPRETDRDYSGDASRPDAVQGGSEPTEAHNLGQAGSTPAPATSSHSSDLHDGRLQAVPAPALDESRDSAAGVEAPAAPVNYPAPGIVIYERCPPEPVRWHEYAECFPWTSVDARDGIDEPIVKIGNLILDGRARYDAARSIGIEYPVVQYAGPDPLTDMIRLNLESRNMSEKDKRAVASRLTKLVPDRADEIMVLFGLEMAEAMA